MYRQNFNIINNGVFRVLKVIIFYNVFTNYLTFHHTLESGQY